MIFDAEGHLELILVVYDRSWNLSPSQIIGKQEIFNVSLLLGPPPVTAVPLAAPPPPDEEESSSNMMLIAGAAGGGVGGLCCICVLFFVLYRGRNRHRTVRSDVEGGVRRTASFKNSFRRKKPDPFAQSPDVVAMAKYEAHAQLVYAEEKGGTVADLEAGAPDRSRSAPLEAVMTNRSSMTSQTSSQAEMSKAKAGMRAAQSIKVERSKSGLGKSMKNLVRGKSFNNKRDSNHSISMEELSREVSDVDLGGIGGIRSSRRVSQVGLLDDGKGVYTGSHRGSAASINSIQSLRSQLSDDGSVASLADEIMAAAAERKKEMKAGETHASVPREGVTQKSRSRASLQAPPEVETEQQKEKSREERAAMEF